MFHPVVRAWFDKRFGNPTSVQERAWPAIAAGGDTLIAAPTGSGKTLAAFLFCLDRLVAAALDGELEDRTFVVYVSPLKALSNDVQKNLSEPLEQIAALAEEMGHRRPRVRTAVRTGDTPPGERRRAVKKPPHVLVTTPESLFILLTSASGRRSLERVGTIIVDEIHAVAPDKRGAHLALSIERLEDLVVRAGNPRPQRVGLSATMRPIEVAAKLLVGAGGVGAEAGSPTGAPTVERATMPAIVDTGLRRDLDLAIEVPKDELGAACTNEQWAELYDRLAALAREHRSTLVFVNTRRLVERLALHLGERLGEGAVAAHHGSLSRARRHLAEQRLKSGELKVVIATASLELGIDVGAVELACVVGSPRSVATALQRIGRSGHMVGGTPKGRFFPLTRDQLVECAAIVRAARRGVLDAIVMRDAPLDILAQQIVAITAGEDRSEDEVFALVRRAAPYADLTREAFDQVVAMLAEGVSSRKGRAGAMVHRDGVNGRLRGRRGARLAALTSGGAIPDTAQYDVVLAPDATKVGQVDEDFAIDSMAGDVFLLGNTSWRIQRVETGRVWVDDARGAPPTIPFWFGEAPARTHELSAEVGALREEVAARVEADGIPRAATYFEGACALDAAGARLLCEYVAAARAVLGALPTQDTVVAERFFDEAGGMQLILHAPFGGRVNRAWGMALRKRFCRSFDFELQAAATDDGVLLSLGPQHSFPLESILELLDPEGLRDVLVQAALQAPMFGTRFRWNATRSLALLRMQGGRRVPPALQRMRSDDLLAAVFPQQVGCQDNHGGMPLEPPDHPLVNETIRDCLTEVMDAEGLAAVLRRLREGAIRFVPCDTPEPSVLSHEILNANPYAFLDDAPLEERRARAVSLRRGLPAEIVERVGGLDPEAIRSVVREAQPDIRTPDELHDLLLDLVALPELEAIAAGHDDLLAPLVRDRRAARLVAPDSTCSAMWVTAERRSLAHAIWPARRFEPDVAEPGGLSTSGAAPGQAGLRLGPREIDPGDALADVVRARLGLVGPVTATELAHDLAVPADDVGIALARIENDGLVLRGRFRHNDPSLEIEWCDRRLLARIHRRTVDGLRKAIEPATAADLIRFLLAWQGVQGAPRHGAASGPKPRDGGAVPRHKGRAGAARVIEQLQGFEIAAGAWEGEVLPARVDRYEPGWLDELCFSGEVVWGRLAPRETGATPTRAAPITLARRRDLAWLLDPEDGSDEGLSDAAREVLAVLGRVGASFFDEIVASTGRGRADVEDALWELVAAGRITGDGFSGLRALVEKSAQRGGFRVGRFRGPAAPIAAGRWSLLRSPALRAMRPGPEEALEATARQYLRRYGVVFRDLLAREPRAPAWRDLVRVYRRLEMRGELRGGRLVQGFVGEQFALPEALDALRAIRRAPKTGEIVRISACDPLNLVGVITPGPRVPAHLGNTVEYRDGVPVDDGGVARQAELPPQTPREPAGSAAASWREWEDGATAAE